MCIQAFALWTDFTGASGTALHRSQHASTFFRRLDLTHVLGWPPHKQQPPNYAEHLRLKAQHPDKLVLLRATQAQPFRALGIDAVIICELLSIKGDQLNGKCALLSLQFAASACRSTWTWCLQGHGNQRHFVLLCCIAACSNAYVWH